MLWVLIRSASLGEKAPYLELCYSYNILIHMHSYCIHFQGDKMSQFYDCEHVHKDWNAKKELHYVGWQN